MRQLRRQRNQRQRAARAAADAAAAVRQERGEMDPEEAASRLRVTEADAGAYADASRAHTQHHVDTITEIVVEHDEAAPSAGALLRYTCPVYVVSPRARARDSPRLLPNFVIAIELPSAESADHWILRGACALCSI